MPTNSDDRSWIPSIDRREQSLAEAAIEEATVDIVHEWAQASSFWLIRAPFTVREQALIQTAVRCALYPAESRRAIYREGARNGH